jgi:2-polyprenyl-3-methyl-5-hydroxy-6-metoxy-1,4-benzoquinol methylase
LLAGDCHLNGQLVDLVKFRKALTENIMEFEELYSSHYVGRQLEKFENRHQNHWAPRIEKVFDLVEDLDLKEGDVLDLGCSIGTYAYEFADRGFQVTGVDLSQESIDIAKHLADKNELSIDYKTSDISILESFPEGNFDIIYAGDIVEHLLEPELKLTIKNCFDWLRPGGTFFVHTVPTKFDKIFFKSRLWMPLLPFAFLPDFLFKKVVEVYFFMFDNSLKVLTGKSWLDRERETVHCNLQRKEDLLNKLLDAGFSIDYVSLSIMEERFMQGIRYKFFKNKEYFQKDVYVIATKQK